MDFTTKNNITNKNHCCPYCGSSNIAVFASPIVSIRLDDNGHCSDILDDRQMNIKNVDELGVEDFACNCRDCGEDLNIVFEESDEEEYRFVKCRKDRSCDFDRKYELFYFEQKKDQEEKLVK